MGLGSGRMARLSGNRGRTGLGTGAVVAVVAVAAHFLLLGGGSGDGDRTAEEAAPPSQSSAQSAGTEATLSDEEASGVGETLAGIAVNDLRFERDGSVFQNREGLLPERPRGYYREYTVITPGSDDRGARRLVIGGLGETYYTRDHYASFVQLDPFDYE